MNLINGWSSYIVLAADKDLGIWDKLPIAFLNTLLGMGTVFSVLIAILGLIALLKYIPRIIDGILGRNESGTTSDNIVNTNMNTNTENNIAGNTDLMQDAQLVAVITAAIMAYIGDETPEDGFVVRSIRRR